MQRKDKPLGIPTSKLSASRWGDLENSQRKMERLAEEAGRTPEERRCTNRKKHISETGVETQSQRLLKSRRFI